MTAWGKCCPWGGTKPSGRSPISPWAMGQPRLHASDRRDDRGHDVHFRACGSILAAVTAAYSDALRRMGATERIDRRKEHEVWGVNSVGWLLIALAGGTFTAVVVTVVLWLRNGKPSPNTIQRMNFDQPTIAPR